MSGPEKIEVIEGRHVDPVEALQVAEPLRQPRHVLNDTTTRVKSLDSRTAISHLMSLDFNNNTSHRHGMQRRHNGGTPTC